MSICLLGSGNWGTTLAHLMACNGHDVKLWCRSRSVRDEINKKHTNRRYTEGFPIHKGVQASNDLRACVDSSDTIIHVIPSKAFREVSRTIAHMLRPDHVIIHATKGLEQGTQKRMSEILCEETCVRQIGVLSGPNIAREILADKPAGTVIATRFPRVAAEAQRLFAGPRFRVYDNSDVVGVEMGGALKNIIAIAGGVIAALELGENARSLLITRGLGEMTRIGMSFGAEAPTFMGLAGMGDLMVTCASPHSRNHRLGRAMAAGTGLEEALASLGMVAEGVNTSRVAHEIATERRVYAPVVEAVYQMVHEDRAPSDVARELMLMEARPDIDL